MVDTPQKRDRNRQKIQKRQDKDFRRKERARLKLQGGSTPNGAPTSMSDDGSVIDDIASKPLQTPRNES